MGNLEQTLKELPFTDLEGEYEEIKRLNKIIVELRELLENLMNENQGLREVVDKQSEYYDLAIRQFNNKNSN